MTEIAFDRDAVYAAIWPALADEIHVYAFDFFGNNETIADAQCDAIDCLTGEIAGNVTTAEQAVAMALDLMRPVPDEDWYQHEAAIITQHDELLASKTIREHPDGWITCDALRCYAGDLGGGVVCKKCRGYGVIKNSGCDER